MKREAWAATVAQFLALAPYSADTAREALSFLAKLLRADALPKNGRDYLAGRLERIVEKESPAAVFGVAARSGARYKGNECLTILREVEREKAALTRAGVSPTKATTKAYAAVALRRTGGKKATAEKLKSITKTLRNEASKARRLYRAKGLTDAQITDLLTGRNPAAHPQSGWTVPKSRGTYTGR